MVARDTKRAIALDIAFDIAFDIALERGSDTQPYRPILAQQTMCAQPQESEISLCF
jgi:hypothetical protein